MPVNDVPRYNYGLPFTYITIYQINPKSNWFFTNFFAGNSGISINPLALIINAIILYYIIIFLTKLFAPRQKIKEP